MKKREKIMTAYIAILLGLSGVSFFIDNFPGTVLWLMSLLVLSFVFFEILAPYLKYSPRMIPEVEEKESSLIDKILEGKISVEDETKLLKFVFQTE
jgi:hypothetical protein